MNEYKQASGFSLKLKIKIKKKKVKLCFAVTKENVTFAYELFLFLLLFWIQQQQCLLQSCIVNKINCFSKITTFVVICCRTKFFSNIPPWNDLWYLYPPTLPLGNATCVLLCRDFMWVRNAAVLYFNCVVIVIVLQNYSHYLLVRKIVRTPLSFPFLSFAFAFV